MGCGGNSASHPSSAVFLQKNRGQFRRPARSEQAQTKYSFSFYLPAKALPAGESAQAGSPHADNFKFFFDGNSIMNHSFNFVFSKSTGVTTHSCVSELYEAIKSFGSQSSRMIPLCAYLCFNSSTLALIV